MEEEKNCPHQQPKLRSDLPPLTERIALLPVDRDRGYPVPFFVQWLKDGKAVHPEEEGATPDFRIVNPYILEICTALNLCWVCGQKLGIHRAYVIGPMCIINRVSAEPPSHVDCAEWSVRGCPFLAKPHMVRRELPEEYEKYVAGHMIGRNPGVIIIWQVKGHIRLRPDHKGGMLFDIGEPEMVRWFKEGRMATEEECVEAIDTGLQSLLDVCASPEERNEVADKRDRLVASLKQVGRRIIIPPGT